MYFPDVVNLRQFYATDLGRIARALIARRVINLWGVPPKGERVLGLGFATPYLDMADGDAVAVMAAQVGAIYWPYGAKNRVALGDEERLPFQDNTFNRVILAHALEHAESAHNMLREVWRVLTPGGRVLAIAPNRLGLWAQYARSPFAYGRPFSSGQLRVALTEAGLVYLRHEGALVMAPCDWRPLQKMMPWLELFGKAISPRFGGVIVMEAEKQIQAMLAEPVRARTAPVMVPVPANASPARTLLY